MNYTEETLHFTCAGNTLLGLLARPDMPASSGFIVVVGGPQYRVGSHRQFVLLSRRLAAAGHAVLRFDYRGMGDSEGQQRPFDSVSQDIAAAIDALQQHMPSVQHIALWGLCDGASAALLYCHDTADSRVRALCLLNPWVRSEESLARTQVRHYYLQRLGQRDFWHKLARGGVAWQALKGLARSVKVSLTGVPQSDLKVRRIGAPARPEQAFQHRMAAAWHAFAGPISLILSGNDYTAKEFLGSLNDDPVWKNALAHPKLIRHDLAGADHTFSTAVARARVEEVTLRLGHTLHQATGVSGCHHRDRGQVQSGAPTQGHVGASIRHHGLQ